MKKKDIQKLNDAMLENVEVPDSVLDMARGEMCKTSPETISSPARKGKKAGFGGSKGGAVAVNRNAVAAVCACAVCAVIIAVALIAWLNRGISNSSSGGSFYNISQLTASEIASVSQYNEENGTEYICPENIDTSTILYTDGGSPVLFAESFTYGETKCIWYVVVEQKNYVDILENFEQLPSETEINGYTAYYNLTEEFQYAEIYHGSSRYCLEAESENSQTLFEVLENILA